MAPNKLTRIFKAPNRSGEDEEGNPQHHPLMNLAPSGVPRDDPPHTISDAPKAVAVDVAGSEARVKQREEGWWHWRRPWTVLGGGWGWTGGGIVMSAAILISVVVVLHSYNGHTQPEWKYMSLNSLISWLSTLAKAALLFSISESIGQSKWTWFARRSRPLSDLDVFDSASRGVSGSVVLLLLVYWRYVFCFSRSLGGCR